MTFTSKLKRKLPASVRNQAAMRLHYISRGHVWRIHKIDRYLSNNSVKKLQVGCGKNLLRGWLNADIVSGDIYLNAKRRMPFKENTFDYIFCEHFIEHISLVDALRFLNECNRILKKRGIIRITTPDLGKIIQLYFGTNEFAKKEEIAKIIFGKEVNPSSCELFNSYMHGWGHIFIYDKEFLWSALTRSGFANMSFCNNKESSHPHLVNLERHEGCDLINLAEAVTIEAKKCR